MDTVIVPVWAGIKKKAANQTKMKQTLETDALNLPGKGLSEQIAFLLNMYIELNFYVIRDISLASLMLEGFVLFFLSSCTNLQSHHKV